MEEEERGRNRRSANEKRAKDEVRRSRRSNENEKKRREGNGRRESEGEGWREEEKESWREEEKESWREEEKESWREESGRVPERNNKSGREKGEELIEEEDITVHDLCDPCLDLFRVTECSPNSPEYIPMKVDAFSRILVPFFFAIFCAYYWPSLLARQVDLDRDETTGYQSSSGHGSSGHGGGH